MTALALLLIGFSIFSAITLAVTHFGSKNYQEQALARIMGLILLLALCTLQFIHFQWLYLDRAWISTPLYRAALFTVAPALFLFSQPLLHPQEGPQIRPTLALHAIPIVASLFFTSDLALPAAFLVGAGYLLQLGRNLYALRNEREYFRLEMYLLGTAFVIALAVSMLGLMQAVFPEKLFFVLYAIAIGAAFLLIQTTLSLRPQLSIEISNAAQTAYSSSTLGNIDCDAALNKLAHLMQVEQLYKDAELNLSRLATALDLSSHQLSELMNSRLGKGFSRYLREQRIDAAKIMLHDELSASVLSVGVNVGFTSQSNFYEAFREIEGMTPGQYRKLKNKIIK